jgi:hypothetical protein
VLFFNEKLPLSIIAWLEPVCPIVIAPVVSNLKSVTVEDPAKC